MKKQIKAMLALLTVLLTFVLMGTAAFAAPKAGDENLPAPGRTAFVMSAADDVETLDGNVNEADLTADEEEAIAEAAEGALKKPKAYSAAIVLGGVAVMVAVGMAFAIGKSVDNIGRQPEASGQIRTSMMLGLVFLETVVIYALIVAILIVFVL